MGKFIFCRKFRADDGADGLQARKPLMTLRQPAIAILTVTMVVALTILAFSPSLHAQQSSLRQPPLLKILISELRAARPVPLITRVTAREDKCGNRCGRTFCEQCMADGN